MFTITEGEFIKDVLRDVILKDPAASSLIGGDNLRTIKVNVFRLKMSLDDP